MKELISIFVSIRIYVFISIFLTCIVSCSEGKNERGIQKDMVETEKLEKEYDFAVLQTDKNNPDGLLKLYELASQGLSAEISEIARDKLVQFLYSKTDLWIHTFAKEDLSVFKHYLQAGGLALLELPKEVTSEEQFEKELLKKLKKIKGNERERELIKYIIDVYEKNYFTPK